MAKVTTNGKSITKKITDSFSKGAAFKKKNSELNSSGVNKASKSSKKHTMKSQKVRDARVMKILNSTQITEVISQTKQDAIDLKKNEKIQREKQVEETKNVNDALLYQLEKMGEFSL
ncbi:hypothetical protein NADFUDRAFT_52394 [Nadsonia fulvescens var. elongata DSM 6958]|uniref:Uncharacterized protein n=1 Tax=Nadsonia fulvescens var. elongata DSM 6958 TaxID=857566 RepID=A0A1E3PHJ1_9ASCO|nr:hypothetical protein NADFUDRAFT_52394 [Nadsonia fulvescens var. elongata DSM 6958]